MDTNPNYLFALSCILAAVLAATYSMPLDYNSNGYETEHSFNVVDNHHKLSNRLQTIEQRLERKLEEKVRYFNYSVDISHLMKLFHMVNEEVAMQWEKIEEILDWMKKFNRTSSGLGAPSITSPSYPSNCHDAYTHGLIKTDGVHFIPLKATITAGTPFTGRCEIKKNAGWTVIQRRVDGTVDFFRDWQDYKEGFGDLQGEFWLGLEKIYFLSNQQPMKLRIEMTDWDGRNYWAQYDHFRLSAESDSYRLHVHGYHGNSGDSMTLPGASHDNKPFSTKDRDNDDRFHNNCAEHYEGAWWFNSCFEAHLNGKYYQKNSHSNFFVRNGIQWNSIHFHASLQSVEMMISPNEDLVNSVE